MKTNGHGSCPKSLYKLYGIGMYIVATRMESNTCFIGHKSYHFELFRRIGNERHLTPSARC